MTVLSAIQDVCAVLPLTRPEAVFSSTEREHFELQALANAAARHIARDCEWQELKAVATVTGDGETEAFDFPADHDRMLTRAELRRSRDGMPLVHVLSSDRWLGMTIGGRGAAAGAWTVYGGRIHVRPAPAAGEEIAWFYMSSKWALDVNGTPRLAFASDTDGFRLPEELLGLCMIWKWRAAKGLAYAEDLAGYEEAREKLMVADRGPRILTLGRARIAGGAAAAWPGVILP